MYRADYVKVVAELKRLLSSEQAPTNVLSDIALSRILGRKYEWVTPYYVAKYRTELGIADSQTRQKGQKL